MIEEGDPVRKKGEGESGTASSVRPNKSSDWMKHPGVQAQQRSYAEFLRKRFHLDDEEKMREEMEKWCEELGV